MKEFKQLHLKVAERKTRSDQSWTIQNEMIKNSSGVLICLNDPNSNLLIGGGFFNLQEMKVYTLLLHTTDLILTSLSGHLVQWLAIYLL